MADTVVGRFFFLIEFKVFILFDFQIYIIWVGSGSAWIRNFCRDPELGFFKVGSGSGTGINHSGSATLIRSICNLRGFIEFASKGCLGVHDMV